MRNRFHVANIVLAYLFLAAAVQRQPDLSSNGEATARRPNILWIITDDQRADSLECYNRATTGKSESDLGFVMSPNIDRLKPEEKLQAIQDYYAFCAYGDALIGDAVEAFKTYCEQDGRDYLIVFAVGDHGWHLGEQGIMAKFGPWKQSIHDAAIVVSSDKAAYPPGRVFRDMVEFVDFVPTILAGAGIDVDVPQVRYLDGYDLAKVIAGEKPNRDYVIGELNVVCGHRAFMRSRDFAFSMRTRDMWREGCAPYLDHDITWALTCERDKADMALYGSPVWTGPYRQNSSDLASRAKTPVLDILPTVADLVGFDIPAEYEINGESLVPFLFTDKPSHRQWLYTYRGPEQLIRGTTVLRDGRHKSWDVTEDPADLTSYSEITDWNLAAKVHREERATLLKILPKFDLYDSEHEAPGIPNQPVKGKGRSYFRGRATKQKGT